MMTLAVASSEHHDRFFAASHANTPYCEIHVILHHVHIMGNFWHEEPSQRECTRGKNTTLQQNEGFLLALMKISSLAFELTLMKDFLLGGLRDRC